MFYLICGSLKERSELIAYLKAHGIYAVFHYLSLHKSPFNQGKHDGRELPWSDLYTDRLVRLPLFYELSIYDVERVVDAINTFYSKR